MPSALNLLSSTLASGLRGWQGISSRTDFAKPQQLLTIYDIENCPFCRIAREALTERVLARPARSRPAASTDILDIERCN